MTTLVGYGSHGRDIEQIWRAVVQQDRSWTPLRLCDDDPSSRLPPPTSPDAYFLGPYFPWVRATMAMLLNSQGWHGAPALVHPTVEPGSNCSFSGGVVIARNAVVDHSVILGEHVHVNYLAAMTRCSIGNFSTISPGVVICGDVKIGERVFIGAGAVITNLLSIGDDAVIGAGTVVRHNVERGEKFTG